MRKKEKDFLLRLISSCLVDMNGENFFFLKYLMDFNYYALREGDILLDFFAQLPDMWDRVRETKREIEKLIH